MSSEPSIDARDISKSYLIDTEDSGDRTFGEMVSQKLRRPFSRRDRQLFWALQDVDFTAHPGEVVGVIGGNGAGKSTLLKILCRITEPSKGRAVLRGRVGSLLEVGTGFHPELTGRENIFLNGAILGMSRVEIQRSFDEIVDFSGIGTFLDTPVKRYSSGMYVRLAFAVAAHLQPEILLVDEVLAVGDADFQRRCIDKMEDAAREEGRTILFVSHNLAAVEALCTRAVLLQDGRINVDGSVADAIRSYLGRRGPIDGSREFASTEAKHFKAIRILDEHDSIGPTIQMDRGMRIEIDAAGLEDPTSLVFGLHVKRGDALVVAISSRMFPNIPIASPNQTLCVSFDQFALMPGSYTIDIGFKRQHEPGFVDFVPRALDFEVVPTDAYGSGYRASDADGLVFLRADVAATSLQA